MSVYRSPCGAISPMFPREERKEFAEEAAPAVPNHKVNILVVDDEDGARETLADIFEEMGYHTETAATAQEALDLLARRFFNIALLDIRLPDALGTMVLERIREIHPDTKCIMATGYAETATAISALNA